MRSIAGGMVMMCPCPRPSTGVDLTLDADQYTVAFADVEGGEFTVRGCSS